MNQISTSHYHLVLDASGSMSDVRLQTLNSLNSQLKAIKQMAANNPESPLKISLTIFNTSGSRLFSNLSPCIIRSVTPRQYKTNGGTALLDALGLAIADTESNMKGDDDAVIMVFTDGEENSSQYFNFRQIADKIRRLKKTDRWTFTFLGADIDAWDIARNLQINRQEVRSISKADIAQTMEYDSARIHDYMERKKRGIRTGFIIDPN